MAPETVPRQNTLHQITEDKDLFRECGNYENEIKSLIKVRHCDKLLAKNDPQFLPSIRRWKKKMGFETPIQWINVILITIYHTIGILWFTVHLFSPYRCKWQSLLFTVILGQIGGFGVTGGAHRYWTHHAFKVKLPLQIILMIAFSVAGQILFNILKLMCCFILPTIMMIYIFGESWPAAILVQCFILYLLNLHFTWSVNSFAHVCNKPYKK